MILFTKKILFCLAVLFLGQNQALSQASKLIFQRPKMGSPFVITVFANDSLSILPIIEKAYQRVDSLNQTFSDYLASSEINRISLKTQIWQTVSPDLYHLLKLSEEGFLASHGGFDITVGSIVKVWRTARKAKIMPNNTTLQAALQKTGFKNIEIHKNLPQIMFHTEGVQLDFGGIVKGYAAQEVVDILTKNGFPNCLVDAGGDLVMGSKTDGWKIAINVPNSENKTMPRFLSLQNQAVATSGDMYQFLEHKGKRYSHIVNPKTGLGLTHQRNITVIAPDGAQADWLATACSVLPIRKAMRLIKRYPNTALLILENKKGRVKATQSPNFDFFLDH